MISLICMPRAMARATQDVTTDSGGRATATIDLALPAANATVPGDVLRVEAEWLGPTRERIVRTTSVKCVLGAAHVVATRPAGLSFALQATPLPKQFLLVACCLLWTNPNRPPWPATVCLLRCCAACMQAHRAWSSSAAWRPTCLVWPGPQSLTSSTTVTTKL